MSEQAYDSEDLLQRLIAEHPSILAGDQFDCVRPKRWLLIKREAGIPDASAIADRWSVDHLFLDQDGVPTFVEVKRSSDSRIRREVVGQMLDYAANSMVYWPDGAIRSLFAASCAITQQDPVERLGTFLNPAGNLEIGGSVEEFWQSVETNLRAGRVRLVFVADEIPPELRRVVEFLNTQMNPAEVIAIEIRQFVGSGVQTLVPIVIGQTAQAEAKRSARAPGVRWNRERFFIDLQDRKGDRVAAIAKELITFAEQNSTRLGWGTGAQYGSCYPMVEKNGIEYYPYILWTNGRVEVQCKWMRLRPPFTDDTFMNEWTERLNKIPDLNIRPEDWSRRPAFDMEALANPTVNAAFENAMKWFWSKL